jgi:RNA 3'-terminal phosphate cyclase (ATP)
LTTLKRFGVDATLEILKRGYYPRGGGRMVLRVNPMDTLRSASIVREEITSTRIRSLCSNLPSHVAERQRTSAEKMLRENGVKNIEADIQTLKSPEAVARGTSILVYSEQRSGVACGGDSVGERGKPAEQVGREAAERHLKWFKSQASVDIHLGDMLIPYCCLADGTSGFSVPEMTGHMKTALSVQEKIVGASYDVQEEEDVVRISIEGKGWAPRQRV